MNIDCEIGEVGDHERLEQVLVVSKIMNLEDGSWSLRVRGRHGQGLGNLEALGMLQLAGHMMANEVRISGD